MATTGARVGDQHVPQGVPDEGGDGPVGVFSHEDPHQSVARLFQHAFHGQGLGHVSPTLDLDEEGFPKGGDYALVSPSGPVVGAIHGPHTPMGTTQTPSSRRKA